MKKVLKKITKEVKNIENYPKEILEYMSEKGNWIMVDPEGAIGKTSPTPEPHELAALKVKDMPEKIKEFFGDLKILDQELTNEDFMDEDVDEKDTATTYSSVFATVYWKEVMDKENGLLDVLEGDYNDVEPDMIFIFNGLELEMEGEEEVELQKVLNVSQDD